MANTRLITQVVFGMIDGREIKGKLNREWLDDDFLRLMQHGSANAESRCTVSKRAETDSETRDRHQRVMSPWTKRREVEDGLFSL